MRCAWTSILKSIWSLNPIGVVKINSSASFSARTTVASGKVAKVPRSISKACAGVPAYGSGLSPPVPSEFTQLVGSGQAKSWLLALDASMALEVGVDAAQPPSRIANTKTPNSDFN